MCTLAARFVRLRPISVTIFVGTKLLARACAEVAADFLPGEEHPLSRVRYAHTPRAIPIHIHIDARCFVIPPRAAS